ncbi:S-adenosylmethionine synthase [Trichinella pseudospiralis]
MIRRNLNVSTDSTVTTILSTTNCIFKEGDLQENYSDTSHLIKVNDELQKIQQQLAAYFAFGLPFMYFTWQSRKVHSWMLLYKLGSIQTWKRKILS